MSLNRSKSMSASITIRRFTDESLEKIKKDAFETWSKPDTAETTYSNFFAEPKIISRESELKQEPRNRPHPSLVFLTTRLLNMPGYFNSKKINDNDESPRFVKSAIESRNTHRKELPRINLNENALPEVNRVDTARQNTNENSKRKSATEKSIKFLEPKQETKFISYHFKRPYRGDFLIHYDWHPRLPHHSLPCLC